MCHYTSVYFWRWRDLPRVGSNSLHSGLTQYYDALCWLSQRGDE